MTHAVPSSLGAIGRTVTRDLPFPPGSPSARIGDLHGRELFPAFIKKLELAVSSSSAPVQSPLPKIDSSSFPSPLRRAHHTVLAPQAKSEVRQHRRLRNITYHLASTQFTTYDLRNIFLFFLGHRLAANRQRHPFNRAFVSSRSASAGMPHQRARSTIRLTVFSIIFPASFAPAAFPNRISPPAQAPPAHLFLPPRENRSLALIFSLGNWLRSSAALLRNRPSPIILRLRRNANTKCSNLLPYIQILRFQGLQNRTRFDRVGRPPNVPPPSIPRKIAADHYASGRYALHDEMIGRASGANHEMKASCRVKVCLQSGAGPPSTPISPPLSPTP